MDVELGEHKVTLRDGTRAVIRPIRPDDKDRLQHGLQQLSPRSRYLRFHAPVRRLTGQQLRYLTEIDYRDHMAWVAENPDAPDDPGMGVARYVRSKEDPSVAEAAITVIDRYQGRGLGTILLRLLAASALESGITTFRNYVLADNDAMLAIFDQFETARTPDGDGVYRIDVPLAAVAEELPGEGPIALLRAAAQGRLPLLSWRFPWTAVLKRRRSGEAS